MSQCLNSLMGMDDTYCAKGLRLVSHEYIQKLEKKIEKKTGYISDF